MKKLLSALLVVLVAVMIPAAIISANGVPAPGDSVRAISLPAVGDPESLNEAYSALNSGERGFQDAMNAIHVLRTGKVAGIDLSPEQMQALKEQGYGGLFRAKERYLDALDILGITPAQLTAWELTNPQATECYEYSGAGVCPTPTP